MSVGVRERRSNVGIAPSLKVESSLTGLIELGARFTGSRVEEVDRLALKLLSASTKNRWRSTLNNDGSPLQVSLSLFGQFTRPAVRFIADPAAATDGRQRWCRAYGVLMAVLASHAPDLRPLCDSVIERILPAEPVTRSALPSGAIWIAVDLSGQGMALYATAKWGDANERWMRIYRWLEQILPAQSEARDILNCLASRSVLVSVGIEGTSLEKARAKLYWRLNGNAALCNLGLPLLDNAAISEFLYDVVEERRILRAGIVGSIGFEVASGNVSDVKLDVCGHCVRRTPTEWVQVIERSTARCELARLPAKFPTVFEKADLAFIGLGVDADERPRLNIYLKRSI